MMTELPDPSIPLERAELVTRLRWFIRLRWLAGGTVLLVGLLLFQFPLPEIRAWQVALIGAGILLYNVLFDVIERWEAGRGSHVEARRAPMAALGQIVADLLALTILLHITGGVRNPLSTYYIFHVVIATLLLPTTAVFGVVALAVGLLSGLGVAEMQGWLPHVRVAVLEGSYRDAGFVLAMLSAFASSLLIAVFIGTSIARKLREREREIIGLELDLAAHARELEEANNALRQADEAKTLYFRRVSHDLKAPLAAQQSLLRTLLIEVPDLAPASRARIERAIARGDDVIALLGDLLTLSRTRDASRRVRSEPVDPAAAVRSVLETQEMHAQEKDLRWHVEIADSLPRVAVEPDHLATLAENLLSNAIKYTPAGGTVTFRLVEKHGALVMQVQDNGIGIDEADVARIGEEFYRTAQARESGSPGTGLGMTIVHSIVRSLQGRIELHSRLGAGTTVTVTLPLPASVGAAMPAGAST